MKFAITLLVLVAAVGLSECFFFAKATTPRHTTHRPTTRRHFAYADQGTPDIGEMIGLIVKQLTKFITPDAFTTMEGFWEFYYTNVLKVVYENFFKKIVAPVMAEQLKAAGVTKNEDIDAFFATNLEGPLKQGLQIINQAVGSLIDNLNADDAKKKVNDWIENSLKPALSTAINYLADNKASMKPHIISFLKNEYSKDAMDLLGDLKHIVKEDIKS